MKEIRELKDKIRCLGRKCVKAIILIGQNKEDIKELIDRVKSLEERQDALWDRMKR